MISDITFKDNLILIICIKPFWYLCKITQLKRFLSNSAKQKKAHHVMSFNECGYQYWTVVQKHLVILFILIETAETIWERGFSHLYVYCICYQYVFKNSCSYTAKSASYKNFILLCTLRKSLIWTNTNSNA